MDIDVLISHPKLSEQIDKIKSLALSKGYNENWLNDGAKGFIDYLPPGYLNRREKLNEKFKHLSIYSISKIDFFIMKLASARIQDLNDIENIQLSKGELKILKKAVFRISRFDNKTAFKMDLFIQEYKIYE